MAKGDRGKQIREFILAEVQRINREGINRPALNQIGDEVVKEMKSMISKGISPIEGNGRFPEYKSKSDVRKQGRSKRGSQKTPSRRKGKPKPTGYPYNVQKDFPNKRPRPVNLFLSGDFLKMLKRIVTVGSQRPTLEIGFEDELSVKKEDGHRTGANGQAKRPIIPQGNEKFAQRIQRVIQTTLNNSLEKYLKVRRR
jgi:hypothetical protein